jgi:prevent-host-death family protein
MSLSTSTANLAIFGDRCGSRPACRLDLGSSDLSLDVQLFVCEHMFVFDSNHKGNVAELAIATEAARLGLSVLKPLTEHERYDLALDLGSRILRVQCKWARHHDGVVLVRVGRSRTSRRGYIRSTYREDEVDALAAYCQVLDRCYLLPVSMIVGRHSVYLRTSPARNNQRAAINFAADYELGAVAQLEERRCGTAEVTGSSPVSSTPELPSSTAMSFPVRDNFADLRQTVGMDEFYAKLARYVRRAEAGGEVLVTRWGRPVARLGPS